MSASVIILTYYIQKFLTFQQEPQSRQRWKFENSRLRSIDAPSHCIEIISDDFEAQHAGMQLCMQPTDKSRSHVQTFKQTKEPPGCGVLFAKISAEGATRVLVFRDRNEAIRQDGYDNDEWSLANKHGDDLRASKHKLGRGGFANIHVKLHLPNGFGVSIVDDTPQELVYFFSRGIKVSLKSNQQKQTLAAEIAHFQVVVSYCSSPVVITILILD